MKNLVQRAMWRKMIPDSSSRIQNNQAEELAPRSRPRGNFLNEIEGCIVFNTRGN